MIVMVVVTDDNDGDGESVLVEHCFPCFWHASGTEPRPKSNLVIALCASRLITCWSPLSIVECE